VGGIFAESQTLLLEDGRSVGAVFELNPVGTEGRSTAFLEQVRDTVTDALQDAFDEHERAPWVVQFFCQDEDDSEAWLETLAAYASPEIRDSAFTREWLTQMTNHMANLTRDEGLFLDNTVTRTRWGRHGGARGWWFTAGCPASPRMNRPRKKR
jgi:hypothetical protein